MRRAAIGLALAAAGFAAGAGTSGRGDWVRPYAPTKLEWLAAELNATAGTTDHCQRRAREDYCVWYTYVPMKDGTLRIRFRRGGPVPAAEFDRYVSTAKYVATTVAGSISDEPLRLTIDTRDDPQ